MVEVPELRQIAPNSRKSQIFYHWIQFFLYCQYCKTHRRKIAPLTYLITLSLCGGPTAQLFLGRKMHIPS